MKSPNEEKNAIYKRLGEIEQILNPQNDKFVFRNDDHPLCKERNELISTFYQYRAYENWFCQRHPSILVSMFMTGATRLQNTINNVVAFQS